MVYSDSHCHLDSYPPEDLKIVFSQMKDRQVEIGLTVSVNLETSAEAVRLAGEYKNILAAVGIHPGEALPLTPEIRRRLKELTGNPRVKAVGEIGLDFMRGREKQELQKELLAYQVSLAKEAGLPIDVHYSHDAHETIMSILRKEKGAGLKGIVHGFDGDTAMLRDWLGLDFYISIGAASLGKMISLHNLPPIKDEVVRAIPAERLLTETDAMARLSVSRWKNLGGTPPPDPDAGAPRQEEFRQPADVVEIAGKIALIRGVPAAELGRAATANLKRILNIK